MDHGTIEKKMLEELTLNEINILKDDPVRPHLDYVKRINGNKKVFLLRDGEKIHAVICSAFTSEVPKSEEDLDNEGNSVCTFYTVWSYSKGAGRDIVNTVFSHIKNQFPNVKRVVTLSPKTEMARNFHLSNGALELSENSESINYEYLL